MKTKSILDMKRKKNQGWIIKHKDKKCGTELLSRLAVRGGEWKKSAGYGWWELRDIG